MKKLKLGFIKDPLTREQMKMLIGGSGGGGSPTSPGPDSGGTSIRSRKCCWNDNLSNCSSCKDVSENATCVAGATLTSC